MKKRLYIQIEEKTLFIALIGNNQILQNKETFDLNNLEIINGTIFNLSSIYTKTKDYLKTNKLHKPITTICWKALSKETFNVTDPKHKNKRELLAWQIILLFSKANLDIEKIIGISPIELEKTPSPETFNSNASEETFNVKEKPMGLLKFSNEKSNKQLNFFKKFSPQKKQSPYPWLAVTSITLLLVISSTTIAVHKKQELLASSKAKLKILEEKTNNLKLSVKKLHTTQKSNEEKEKQIDRIKRTKSKNNIPKQILETISNEIPNKCWTKNIKITSKLKSKKIMIECLSPTNSDISIFSSNLEKSNIIKNIKIESITRKKNKSRHKTAPTYSFKLTGDII